MEDINFWLEKYNQTIPHIKLPKNTTIEEIKYKLEQWPLIKKLISIIKIKGFEHIIKYRGRMFNHKWNEFEIVNNITFLNCRSCGLEGLPNMPNLRSLCCGHNLLTSLPYYPKLESLCCGHNFLTSLPYYPKLRGLWCGENKITKLPDFPLLTRLICYNNYNLTDLPNCPNLWELNCYSNYLAFIPFYPKLRFLNCIGNPLPCSTLQGWKDYYKLNKL